MASTVIKAVPADFIAPSYELPAKLLSVLKNSIPKNKKSILEKDTSSFEKISALSHNQTDNDF
jgi:hypothetical protein